MPENKVYTVIGLMSGTSLDGVDCALIETDGREYVKPKAFVTVPYPEALREDLRACFGLQSRLDSKVREPERILTVRHIEAVEMLLKENNLSPKDIDLIGFHGQTIHHEGGRVSVQIGDCELMARETGIDVVGDLRSNDVRHGGEGAPLAPLYHAARIRGMGVPLPCAVLNIGGVANVTWIGEGEADILAFDTGPGNALLDDWVKSRTSKAYDESGKLAAAGASDQAKVEHWLSHDYFTRRPPKSLDRGEWDISILGDIPRRMDDAGTEDGAATLMDFTVRAVSRAAGFFPAPVKGWYVCGGGRHNGAMMRMLNERLDGAVGSVDALGWNGDATEGECFAYLAVRSVLGLPLSLPTTTGVSRAQTGGVLFKAR